MSRHDERAALGWLAARPCDAVLVDFALASALAPEIGKVPRRIVLIAPGDRHELPALKAAGFTGYLVKPVRAVSLAARLGATEAFELAPPLAPDADADSRAGGAGTAAVDPGRRGQRDQRAARPCAADETRPPADDRPRRRSRGRGLANGACGRHTFRPRVDGRADARHGRAGGGPPHPRRRSRGCRPKAHPHAGAHRQRLRGRPRRLPVPPAWTGCWSSRSPANGWPRQFPFFHSHPPPPKPPLEAASPRCHNSVSGPWSRDAIGSTALIRWPESRRFSRIRAPKDRTSMPTRPPFDPPRRLLERFRATPDRNRPARADLLAAGL